MVEGGSVHTVSFFPHIVCMAMQSKGRSHNQKTGKFRTLSEIGGGVEKNPNKSKIQIRTFENGWGGVGIFQKSLNFKYFDHMGLQVAMPGSMLLEKVVAKMDQN